MFNSIDFKQCIADNLKGRRYEHKRIKEITDAFDTRVNFHKSNGVADLEANILAMRDTFDTMTEAAIEKAKRTSKQLAVVLDNNERVAQGLSVDVKVFTIKDVTGKQVGPRGSRGIALGRAAVSMVEDDPRFNGLSYSTRKENYRSQLYPIFGDVLERMGKGIFGRQKGAAHFPNVIREAFGKTDTGDQSAKDFAQAWLKISDLGVDLMNMAGGSMRKLERYIPQSQNAAKMAKVGEERWIAVHMDALDWGKMRWPDGTMIKPDEQLGVLREIFETLISDGANKIDPASFRGRGRAVGNLLDNHRFMHYKDADSWLAVHEEFGDGSVFDVFIRHIEQMSHRIALIDTFGPNPEMAAANLELAVKKAAAGLSARDKADADAILKNKFRPMMDVVLRNNPMDPNSGLGNLIVSVSNMLVPAQVASAVFLAVPGDFMTTAMVRSLNGMENPIFGGTASYLKMLAGDIDERAIALQSGYVSDQIVSSTYATTRFTGMATAGPAVTRRIGDVIMRASLLSGHTTAARWAPQAEFMGLMARSRQKAFSDLPFSHVLQRYGIGPDEWDTFRAMPTAEVSRGVEFLRPIDILDSDIGNKQRLYQMFQGMMFEESRKMVPEGTIEASVALKDTTRPDTLPGAILHSFAMYKSFPMTIVMSLGRLGMTSPSVKGRLGFYAGLGAGMTLVGALGTQMREISRGRDPLPMDNAAFLGKSFLSGGALSIWGDFLFSGVNAYGSGPQDVVGGPIPSLLGDTTQLVFGDTFQWADTVGTLGDRFESSTAAKAVEWVKRYSPVSSLWWSRLALERQVFDRLQELADPNAYKKRQRQMRRQETKYGNKYWFEPGTRTPQRMPQLF